MPPEADILGRGAGRIPLAGRPEPAAGDSIESAYSWWLAALTLIITSLSIGAVTAVPILLKPLAQEWITGAGSIAWVHTSTPTGAGLGSIVLLWTQRRLLDDRAYARARP